MENPTNSSWQRSVWFYSLQFAPLLLFFSQFFWNNGVLNIQSGWLQVLAFTFWIPAFQGMFELLKSKMPAYAAIGFLIAIYACIGGNNFGVDGIYGEAAGVFDVEAKNALHEKLGVGAIVALYLPGLLFPLSLLVLGFLLYRTKTVESWLAILLMVGAIGFPLSRIPREPLLAHADNFILVLSHSLIAMRHFRK